MTLSVTARVFDNSDSYDASPSELLSPTMLPMYQDDDSISNDSLQLNQNMVKIEIKNKHLHNIK